MVISLLFRVNSYRWVLKVLNFACAKSRKKLSCCVYAYKVAQKSKPKPLNYQIIKISYWIVLKPASLIRFIREIKVSINTKILSVGIKYSERDLPFDVNNYV